MSTILITGGSGMIGTALTRKLLDLGHVVRHLSRTPGDRNRVPAFGWDVAKGRVDVRALQGVDHIVHLAGAGIVDKRWTEERVRLLIASRADSAALLLRVATAEGLLPRSFVSAAGIGHHGAITTDKVFTEEDPPGTDTIARISVAWEDAADQWARHTRVVKLRTPIVLSSAGGALGKLAAPVRWGLGAPLGSGRQWMPWVHIDDLIQVYAHALFNEHMHGAYNVNASDHIRNREFMATLAKALHRPYFLPAVPGVLLKLLLGESAAVILQGSRASNAKIRETGFRFHHDELSSAIHDLIGRRT
ncbi:MAG: TIGR01777 family oxidoreductase [Flavobacteriales bacterium]|nr:TIGR01777 family oxidoreductase [Flavobacteriales bacterium]